MNLSITHDESPKPADIEILQRGLDQFNFEHLNEKPQEFAIYLRDDKGTIHGGVFALAFSDSIHIILLWVDKDFRGQGYGSKLLKAAEDIGASRKCQFIFTDTFGFQADTFYEKCGYECVGKINDILLGYPKVCFKKKIS